MFQRFFTLLLVAFAVVSQAAYTADEITSLPGWLGALPSPQYSGYLTVGATNLHYWLVTSESDPANDPVVVWFNGGPGCSSLDGFVYEHGPFEFSANGSTLSLRPYRWNLKVNMLYIEAPVGVGFSYNTDKNYALDDDRTATENLGAIQAFYAKFPELIPNKFFITGESYAGVYVPTLAEAILQAEEAGTYVGAQLTGIAVGNGCSGTEVGICGDGPQGTYYEWEYLKQTSFINPELKTSIDEACGWALARNNTPNALSVKCVNLLVQASSEIGHVNMYNIYGDCVDDMCPAIPGEERKVKGKIPMRKEYVVTETPSPNGLSHTTSRRLARITPYGPDACIDSGAASAYFNRADVQAAIHVQAPGFCWAVCNTAPTWSYKSTRTNLPANTYPLLTSNLQVLIYNGDWDACVPYTDGEGWTQSMGYPIKSAWHNWIYTSAAGNADQVAGYAVVYDVSQQLKKKLATKARQASSDNSFSFITIRGGRHEVPETAPAQALEMLNRLIAGKSF